MNTESVLLFFDVVVYASSLLLSIFGWQRFLLFIDKHYFRKKSKRNTWIFFVAGFLSPYLLLYIVHPLYYPFAEFLGVNQGGVGFHLNEFATGILVTGPTEEFSKFLVFYLVARYFKTFHEPKDAMIQCATVALGFAVNENIIYANDYGAYNMAIRSLLCIAGHMIFTSIIGYFYGLLCYYRLSHRGIHPERLALLAILPAGFIHGMYNFIQIYGAYLSILAVLIGTLIVFRMYEHLVNASPYRRYLAKEANQGISEIKNSLSFHGKNSYLLKRLGLYHIPLKKYSEALVYLNQSIEINPRDKIARIDKAIAHFGNGEKDKGENQLQYHKQTLDKYHLTIGKDIKEYVKDPELKAVLLARVTPVEKVAPTKPEMPAPVRNVKKKG